MRGRSNRQQRKLGRLLEDDFVEIRMNACRFPREGNLAIATIFHLVNVYHLDNEIDSRVEQCRGEMPI